MKEFEDADVKLTYRDGEHLRVYYGVIEFVDDMFIRMQFKDGSVSLVNRSEVMKIVKR